jgi:LysM repeat protein
MEKSIKDTFSSRKIPYFCPIKTTCQMKKNTLFLFLILFVCTFDLSSQTKGVAVIKLFDKEYYKYEVKSKETLYSLCRRFSVTEAELLPMNPTIVDGLKTGQTLLIPVKQSEPEVKVKSKEMVVSSDKRKNPLYFSTDRPRLTVLLPFAPTSAAPGASERYLEFYEGLLLAVDSLKSLGLSFEVQAIESRYDDKTIQNIISTGELDETDYCIGGVTASQITLLANWAKKNQRILILPFSSRIPEIENNPYLFQTNTSHQYMYDQLANYAVSKVGNSNIVFIKPSIEGTDSKPELLSKVKSKLQSAGISFTEVNDDENLEALSKVLSNKKFNQIMPYPMNLQEANSLVARLDAYFNAHPDQKMLLIGYPDWQAMSKSYQKYLYELNTVIFSNFYADVQQQNVRDFQIQFNRIYDKSLLNTYPKYGMMGYDIATYFIPRMVFEKSEVLDTLPYIAPLQNEFRFGNNKPLYGASNKSFYLIHYTTDNNVEVNVLE